MRLGFHYHIPATVHGSQIRMPAHQGRFVDSLADYCSEIVCFLHSSLAVEQEQMDYTLQNRNVRLVDLGAHTTVPRRLLSARHSASLLRGEVHNIDALLLRGPSPLLPALAGAVHPTPTALLLVGDAVALVGESHQPWWRREAIRLLWNWNRLRQTQVARRSLTFVNSRKLYEELRPAIPDLLETRTTTLTKSDFFDRADTCLCAPFRLLYTGRMTRGKGLVEMVEALALLVSEGENLVLDLVGWPEKNEDVLDEVRRIAGRLAVAQRVLFHGPKAAGPELFACYRRADIYVIASKTSEGFPRTIWEAMAHSLPVVASNVGSIAQFAGAAVALSSPGDYRSLAAEIRTILRQPRRRQEMIQAGRRLAASVTLEEQVAQMVQSIEQWVARCSKLTGGRLFQHA